MEGKSQRRKGNLNLLMARSSKQAGNLIKMTDTVVLHFQLALYTLETG
jgi:hypothetical protein